MDRLGGIFDARGDSDDAGNYLDSGDEAYGYSHGRDDDYDDGGHFDAAPPSPVGQDERRMQVRAYNHWAGLLGDSTFPSIAGLDPEAITDFGPYSVLLDFTAGVDDPAVRFLGAELAVECGAHGHLDRLSDVPSRSLLSRITDHYMQILANQAPIGFEAEFVNQRGNVALYRGILLPYSSNDETIDFIYGVINWKEMADQATADELLLEIGQALDRSEAPPEALNKDLPVPFDGLDPLLDLDAEMAHETATPGLASSTDSNRDGDDGDDSDNTVGPLGALGASDEGNSALPSPAFGAPRAKKQALPAPDYDEDPAYRTSEADASTAAEEDAWSIGETASDYGLSEDWDEPDPEDVDDLVDPLADHSLDKSLDQSGGEKIGFGLSSLVTRGARAAPAVIMPAGPTEPRAEANGDSPAIPQAYEPDEPPAPLTIAPVMPVPAIPTPVAAVPVMRSDEADDPASGDEAAEEPDPADGLYDCLAEARELAQVANSSEDRSRSALYRAVGRAYDFSLAAQADPQGFAELVADSGIAMQDRAPMTPVVKLVFGADYDKTRVTEYAAALSHAHRLGLGTGALADHLRAAKGGLKGVVREERLLRREEDGKPARDTVQVRDAIAARLRAIAPIALADCAESETGAEFALVMIRRLPDGTIAVLGAVPDEVPLVERAARKLLG